MSDDRSLTRNLSTQHSICGLELLRQVHSYAQEFQRSPWDFAVEIVSLRRGGFTDNDLRWLILNGYLEHARELPMKNHKTRQFVQFGSLTFNRRSCFIPINPKRWLMDVQVSPKYESPDAAPPATDSSVAPSTPGPQSVRPTWDAVKQQLRLGQHVVKSFKHPCVPQAVILSAFEAANWPSQIEDPLPNSGLFSPQLDLQDAINCLNSNQRTPLIQFNHDESSRSIMWTHAEQSL